MAFLKQCFFFDDIKTIFSELTSKHKKIYKERKADHLR